MGTLLVTTCATFPRARCGTIETRSSAGSSQYLHSRSGNTSNRGLLGSGRGNDDLATPWLGL